jgi:hypothetical protein
VGTVGRRGGGRTVQDTKPRHTLTRSYQTKCKWYLKQHQARVHNVGNVEFAEERRVRQREARKVYNARQPSEACGIGGCMYSTNHKGDMKKHKSNVHGVVDDAATILLALGKMRGGGEGGEL